MVHFDSQEEVFFVRGLLKRWLGFELRADFEIQPGERRALIGKTGSGKTSLLRMIAGFDEQDEGKIFSGSRCLGAFPIEKRGVGFVTQENTLFPSLTVKDNLVYGLRMRGASKKEMDESLKPWVEALALSSLLRRAVSGLSGGERQKVAWVRALVWKPRILLLDEPFSALDVDSKKDLVEAFLKIHEVWKVPVLLVTHDATEVKRFAHTQMQVEIDVKRRIHRISY